MTSTCTHRHMITFSCAIQHAAFTLPAAVPRLTSSALSPLCHSSFCSPHVGADGRLASQRQSAMPYISASLFRSPFRPLIRSQPPSSSPRPGRGFFNSGAMSGNGKSPSSPPNSPSSPDLDRGLFASSPELEQLAMKSTDAPILTRIVSYNILSSSLAGASHFPGCKPSNLDSATRLRRVLTKLEGPVAARSIICLQEVSLSWSGHLHAFFANRGFHLLLTSHGSYFSGYMGEGLAFPLDLYEPVDLRIERLTDTMQWPTNSAPSRKRDLSFPERLQKAWKILFPPSPSAQQNLSSFSQRPKREPWDHARGRNNRFIFARLRSRTNGAKFCVATYHMPCVFWSPPVMLIHAGLIVRQFQRLCGSDLGVLAGDFNIKPGDSTYEMILKGKIDPTHPDFPPNCPDGSSPVSWFPMPLAPLKSAYKEVLGHEPDFTNYAKVEEQPTFIETLDYVFCTQDVDVVDVVRLPHRKAVVGPFPDAVEPSDHVLIGATLRLPAPVRQQFQGTGSDFNLSTGTELP